MSALFFLLGVVIRLASITAYAYLIWNGRWLVILTAIGFSLLTPVLTGVVNLPMGIFWKELGYPEALSSPGLRLLVNPLRLLIVSRIPQLVYGGLAYCIGVAAFLLFGSANQAIERASLMIAGYEAGFAAPRVLATTLTAQAESRGVFLLSQLFYGKMAFLALLVVHSITPLGFWPAAGLLAVAMLVLEGGFEVAAWRRPLPDIVSQN